jgi:hypothetical protein
MQRFYTKDIWGEEMELEDRVVSLELAKEMKEVGVEQDSAFYWIQQGEYSDDWSEAFIVAKKERDVCYKPALDGECSAPTVAELGEMLPGEIQEIVGNAKQNRYYLDCGKIDSEHSYYVRYTKHDMGNTFYITHRRKEADARAKMILYLIKTGIIKAEEVGK